jgi:regulator of protease activity HflC (stomatin/prohibitin superfamily)
VKSDEESVKASLYNAHNYYYQVVNLARTTLRNIRHHVPALCQQRAAAHQHRAVAYPRKRDEKLGLEITRTELKEIDPPKDVQETMNKVVKAETRKSPPSTSPRPPKRGPTASSAPRSKAEGIKQSKILAAEGEAQPSSSSTRRPEVFRRNAQLLRQLEAVETSLKNNAKVVVPTDSQLVNVIGEMAGVLPLDKKPSK